MSRSHKKRPFLTIVVAHSEKQDKKIWHSRMRAHERDKLKKLTVDNLDEHETTLVNDVSNPYVMEKDGSTVYYGFERKHRIFNIVTLGEIKKNDKDKKGRKRFWRFFGK